MPFQEKIDTRRNTSSYHSKEMHRKKNPLLILLIAGIGDLVMASVTKGKPDIRKQVVFAVIVRQKKEYRRPDGTRIKFEDNSAVVLKDDAGNPKGTIFKGPIAKEACDRWPGVAKIANMIV